MNKVVTINLNGVIISIDEVAFDQLKSYIDALHKHFSGTSGSAEIISDIETRIAELLQLKLTADYTVIQLKDVNEVIAIMGNPWELDSEDTHEEQQSNQHQQRVYERKLKRDPHQNVIAGVCGGLGNYFNVDPIFVRAAFLVAMLVFGTGFLLYFILWVVMPEASPEELPQFSSTPNRKLFRSADNKMLGGVCSGISAYLDIDEIWLRIAFAVAFLAFGSGFLAYIILWAIIPEARTATEKLHMKGSTIDVNNIEREIRNAAGNVVQQAQKKGSGVNVLLKLLAILVAVSVFFFAILPGMVTLFFVVFGVDINPDFEVFIKSMLIDDQIFNQAQWGIVLIISSIMIGLVSFIFRLFSRFKLRYFSALSTMLFLIGVVLCVMAGRNYAKAVKVEAVVLSEDIEMMPSDTFEITLNEVLVDEDEKQFNIEINHSDVNWSIYKEALLFNQPKLYIKPASGTQMQVKVKHRSNGSSEEDAETLAKQATVNPKISQHQLIFDDWVSIGKNPYKQQSIDVGVWIPLGKLIKIDASALERLKDFDEDDYTEKPFQYFKMTEAGLVCLTCSKQKHNQTDSWEDVNTDITIEQSTSDSTSEDGKVKVVKSVKKIGPITVTNIETTEKK